MWYDLLVTSGVEWCGLLGTRKAGSGLLDFTTLEDFCEFCVLSLGCICVSLACKEAVFIERMEGTVLYGTNIPHKHYS